MAASSQSATDASTSMGVSTDLNGTPGLGEDTAQPDETLTEEALREGFTFREKLRDQFSDSNRIVRTVRLIGGAMITLLLVAVVLNEIFGAVNVGSGPFSGIGTDLETTGVAAISLLVVGLLIVAANRLMSIFGGGGGM